MKDNTINKDIVQLIKFILFDYFEQEIVEELSTKIGTVDFFIELNIHLLDKVEVKNQVFNRLQGIYQGLGHMLDELDEKEGKNKFQSENKLEMFRLLIQNRYDTEFSEDEYDFINKQYTIHSSLKYALNRKNMTQLELSQKTKIPRATLSNIIKNPNSASFFNVVKIAYTLDMNIHDLFYIREESIK